jgi:pyrimidine 5'-nucleotidase
MNLGVSNESFSVRARFPKLNRNRRRKSSDFRSCRRRSSRSCSSSSSSSSSSSNSSWLEGKTCLIFDLDGVLYPASNGYLEHVRENQRKFLIEKFLLSGAEARDVQREAFARHNQTLKGLRSFGYAVDHDEFTEYVRRGMYEYLKPDVTGETQRTLLRLKENKNRFEKIILLTNTAEKEAKKCLDALGIDGEYIFADGIYGSSFLGDFAKPMPEAFKEVCKDINVNPSACVMIEDSFKNLRTCVETLNMAGVFIAGETMEFEEGCDEEKIKSVANVVVDKISSLEHVSSELFI